MFLRGSLEIMKVAEVANVAELEYTSANFDQEYYKFVNETEPSIMNEIITPAGTNPSVVIMEKIVLNVYFFGFIFVLGYLIFEGLRMLFTWFGDEPDQRLQREFRREYFRQMNDVVDHADDVNTTADGEAGAAAATIAESEMPEAIPTAPAYDLVTENGDLPEIPMIVAQEILKKLSLVLECPTHFDDADKLQEKMKEVYSDKVNLESRTNKLFEYYAGYFQTYHNVWTKINDLVNDNCENEIDKLIWTPLESLVIHIAASDEAHLILFECYRIQYS